MDTNHLLQFLQEQSVLADFRAKSYIQDSHSKKRPQRNIFIRLQKYITDFMEWNRKIRWITLTWLRWSGKTTILFQLYSLINSSEYYKLFLSLDNTHGLLWVSLHEVLSTYEKLLWQSFETLDKPLILFLDEVQYDSSWWLALKSLYDRTDKVFIFSTGSAAIMLNTNADIARRTIYEKMYPLSFTEYLKIAKEKYEIKWLGANIRDAIIKSETSNDAYLKLSSLENDVNMYYMGVMQSDYHKYLWYGSLPHMVDFDDESIVYDQIQKTLDRIIHSDLPMVKFHPDTVWIIPWVLYALADMDSCNVTKMAEKFSISRPKMWDILDALEWAELLKRIYPYASHLSQATSRKPSKYLFSAPAFRAIYYRLMSNIISNENAKWKITEDLVAMYFYKIFDRLWFWSLTYDSSQWWADLILQLHNQSIIIEVGSWSKWYRQVIQTMKKIDAKFGIIISDDPLEINGEHNIIKIPLRMFLLV